MEFDRLMLFVYTGVDIVRGFSLRGMNWGTSTTPWRNLHLTLLKLTAPKTRRSVLITESEDILRKSGSGVAFDDLSKCLAVQGDVRHSTSWWFVLSEGV